jgi:hypothetical protein
MSSFVEISALSSQVNTNNDNSSSSKPYNDLLNFGSIRKQFIRIVPQYMSLENKKLYSKNKFTSNIEELNKYKQEIISLKESISLLQEKKQRKLEQIEELRCLMRKVGNKQHNSSNNNFHINNYHKERETKDQRNNDQRFRGASDKKHRFAANTTTTCDDNEGGLSLLPSSSGLSSGKDDDTAPESGIYQDNQEDFNLSLSNSNSSSTSSCCNNCRGWRCCFGVEKDKAAELKGLHENDCPLLEKEN